MKDLLLIVFWSVLTGKLYAKAPQDEGEEPIRLRGEMLEKVEILKYPGANISANGDCMQYVLVRTAAAQRTMIDQRKT